MGSSSARSPHSVRDSSPDDGKNHTVIPLPVSRPWLGSSALSGDARRRRERGGLTVFGGAPAGARTSANLVPSESVKQAEKSTCKCLFCNTYKALTMPPCHRT